MTPALPAAMAVAWAAVLLPWLAHGLLAREAEARRRRLARVPVWTMVALLEIAAAIAGSMAAWAVLMALLAVACWWEIAVTMRPAASLWPLAGLAAAAVWLTGGAWGPALLASFGAGYLLLHPYGAGLARRRSWLLALLVYFAAAPLALWQLTARPELLATALLLAFLVHLSDIAAGTIGKLGQWRPLPRLSPSKTVEGYAGGLLVVTVAGAALGGLLGWPPLAGGGFGLFAGLAAGLGDLVASKAKRLAGVKDFSTWLGPHGGFCDRADSLILATAWLAPAAASGLLPH